MTKNDLGRNLPPSSTAIEQLKDNEPSKSAHIALENKLEWKALPKPISTESIIIEYTILKEVDLGPRKALLAITCKDENGRSLNAPGFGKFPKSPEIQFKYLDTINLGRRIATRIDIPSQCNEIRYAISKWSTSEEIKLSELSVRVVPKETADRILMERYLPGGTGQPTWHKVNNQVKSTDQISPKPLEKFFNDFQPFKTEVRRVGDNWHIPLANGNILKSDGDSIDWNEELESGNASNELWRSSMEYVGKLLTEHSIEANNIKLDLALNILESFFRYEDRPENWDRLSSLPSQDHAASVRLMVLIKSYPFILSSATHNHLARRCIKSILFWQEWLLAEETFTLTNHGLMGIIALLHSGVFVNHNEIGKRVFDTAMIRTKQTLEMVFDRDGLCHENTPGYHNYNLNLLRRIIAFLKYYKVQHHLGENVESTLGKGEAALAACLWPNGQIPPLGDSSIYDTNITPSTKSKFFLESGFGVIRKGSLYLSVTCGSRSEAHKQSDDLSFTLFLDGRELFTDGGSLTYDKGNPYRRCIASTSGHSGLFPSSADGLLREEFLSKYAPAKATITDTKISENFDAVTCSQSLRNGALTAQRRFIVPSSKQVAIIDRISISTKQEGEHWVARFLLGPDIDVATSIHGIHVLSKEETIGHLYLSTDAEVKITYGQVDPAYKGWASKRFGEVVPATCLDIKMSSEKYVIMFSTTRIENIRDLDINIRNELSDEGITIANRFSAITSLSQSSNL